MPAQVNQVASEILGKRTHQTWVNSVFVEVLGKKPAFLQQGWGLWLMANNFHAATNTPVSRWVDQTMNMFDAVQSNPTYQPVIVNNALNGCPVIRFNSSLKQYLTVPNATSFFQGVGSTTFIVGTPNFSGSGGPYDIEYDSAFAVGSGIAEIFTTGQSNGLYRYSNGKGYASVFRDPRLTQYPLTPPSTGSHLFTYSSGPSYYEMFIDGVSQGQTTPGYSPGISPYIIGACRQANGDLANYWNGDIAEIISFNFQLSDDNRLGVEKYLNNKYFSWNPHKLSPLRLWLDASSLNLANNAKISSWPDLINGKFAIQPTLANQPQFTTNSLNGLPSVKFTKASATHLYVPAIEGLDNNTFTISVVGRCSMAPSSGLFHDFVTKPVYANTWTAPFARYQFRYNPNDQFEGYVQDGNTLVDRVSVTDTTFGSYHYMTFKYNGSTLSIYKNGILVGSKSYSTTITPSSIPLYIGGFPGTGSAEFLEGNICEILYSNEALDSTDQTALDNYLLMKYGVLN